MNTRTGVIPTEADLLRLLGRFTGLATKARLDFAALAFGWLFVASLGAYSWVKPFYNWDMVAYVATAMENRIEDNAELHAETWRQLRAHLNDGQYYELSAGNPYNKALYEDADAFASQLSMYRVKPAYVWTIRALEPVVGLVNASMFASVAFVLLFGVLVLEWLRRNDAIQSVFVLLPMLVIADYLYMGISVLPDMMLAAVTMAGALCFLRGRYDWASLLLFLSLLVRPDNIVFMFALLLAMIAFRLPVRTLAIAFAAGLICLSATSEMLGHPGWWAHFWFSNLELQVSMTGFDPPFSIGEMLHGYFRGISVALQHSDWPWLLTILVGAWVLLARNRHVIDRAQSALLFAMLIGLPGKFVSFPLPDDRFYFVFISVMAVVLATVWKPRFDLAEAGKRA